VHFQSDASETLPWTFKPLQKDVKVLPGETALAFYRAKNEGTEDLIGIATYNMTPEKVSVLLRYRMRRSQEAGREGSKGERV
jgi:cytochrome c oxidase assembly protein subunit 11